MTQLEINLNKLESELRIQANNFVTQLHGHTFENHNSQSILLRLTGRRFDDLKDPTQLDTASNAVGKALAAEAKKSRTGRYNYDPNRHIALHQAIQTLKSMKNRRDERTDIGELCAIKKAGEIPALDKRI